MHSGGDQMQLQFWIALNGSQHRNIDPVVGPRDGNDTNGPHSNASSTRGSPAAIGLRAVRPTVDGSMAGGSPVPGRITTTDSRLSLPPCGMSTAASRLLRATWAASRSQA